MGKTNWKLTWIKLKLEAELYVLIICVVISMPLLMVSIDLQQGLRNKIEELRQRLRDIRKQEKVR